MLIFWKIISFFSQFSLIDDRRYDPDYLKPLKAGPTVDTTQKKCYSIPENPSTVENVISILKRVI